MPVSYNKLWKKMKEKGMNKTKLREATCISSSTMAKLGNNEPVALTVLEKVCAELRCNIGDVMEFTGHCEWISKLHFGMKEKLYRITHKEYQ